jgi:hypothetical protein
LHQTKAPALKPGTPFPAGMASALHKTDLHGPNDRLIRAVLGAKHCFAISPEKLSEMDEAQHPFSSVFWVALMQPNASCCGKADAYWGGV